jgi:ABC-type nitrate/sulfonate/bicarbonate transport system substrate-binding protein
VLNPPISYVAAEQGFKKPGELSDYISAVQFTAVSVGRGWAYQNPKLTADYLVALLRANSYVYENRSGAVRSSAIFLKFSPIMQNGFMTIGCAIK